MKYIVILNRYGSPMFLVDDDDNAVIFNDYIEAHKAGDRNALGNAAGFDVIEWNYAKPKSMEL